jgi:transcriptional regulator GlxA family with amidase domain
MHVAILTLDGFNEIDSLLPFGILNRVQHPDWRVSIASPSAWVKSMNGLVLGGQASLREVASADAVIVGSGIKTRDIVSDPRLMDQIQLDATNQLIGAQCSGALLLAKLGLLDGVPACTDLITKPWLESAGVTVLTQPFFARGKVATAGGCLASHYLAAWVIANLRGMEAAENALHYVAPVGEKDEWVARAMKNIAPFLPGARVAA